MKRRQLLIFIPLQKITLDPQSVGIWEEKKVYRAWGANMQTDQQIITLRVNTLKQNPM